MPIMTLYEKWSLRAAWFALFLSLVMPLVVQYLSPRLFRADIAIEFDLKRPFVIKTTIGNDAMKEYNSGYLFRIGIRNRSGYYEARNCKVMLIGLSHKRDDNFRETGLSHKRDNNFREEENFEPVQLGWNGTKAKGLSAATDTSTSITRFTSGVEQFQDEQDFERARLGWGSTIPEISAGMRVFAQFGRIMPPSFQRKHDAGLYSGDPNKPQFRFSVPNYPRWMSSHVLPGKHRFKITLNFENHPPVQQEFELDWSGKWSDDYESMLKEIIIRRL